MVRRQRRPGAVIQRKCARLFKPRRGICWQSLRPFPRLKSVMS